VAADPTERGVRAVLNLGHTIGHGVEAAAGYGGLGHGQAVAVGLSAALWLSARLRGLDPAVVEETEAVLAARGLPLRAPGLDAGEVLAAMRGDKKRVGGRVRFVLLDAPGRPVWGVDVPDDDVRAAVERAVAAA
jgi:3-dehydroquinate synthetase